MSIRNLRHCLVCGADQEQSLAESEFHSCFCCGAEIGYTYPLTSDVDGVLSYRAEWMGRGCEFEDDTLKPEGWNTEMALAQIKANVPAEFQ